MPVQYENTGAVFTLVETDNINKVPFKGGQYIIVDNGMVYYDPTIGTSIDDRCCLTPQREVDVNDRSKDSNGEWLSDEYYLELCTNPINGDVNIIRDTIDGTDKKEYTIYTYDGKKWIKETGSYNAKNVYLDDDVSLTFPFNSNNTNKFNTKGLSLFDALNKIFAPDVNPTIKQPSVIEKVSINNDIILDYNTNYMINYDLELDPGEYQYGPDTNVDATNYKVVSSDGIVKLTKSGSIPVTNPTKDFYIDFYITHTNGSIPYKFDKKSQYLDGQILAGTISKRLVYKVDKADIICGTFNRIYNEITPDMTLNLNKFCFNENEIEKIVNLEINVGTGEICILIPKDVKILSILNTETGCNMFNAFDTDNIVFPYNDDTLYNAYTYKPANKFTIATTLVITIKKENDEND